MSDASPEPDPGIVDAPPKSSALAATFALLFCGLGIHHLYLGRPGRGLAQWCLLILGALLATVGVGIPMVLAAWIWSVTDAVRILSGRATDVAGRPLA